MSAPPTAGRIDLGRFTLDSLYFCGTPVDTFRRDGLLAAVNDWYMGFIRSGWAVPLSFVLDVAALLLFPAAGLRDRWKDPKVRPEVRALALRYYATLQKLRRDPVFATAATLARAADGSGRGRVVKTVLRLLLAELSGVKDIYSFDTRDLTLTAATPSADGLRGIKMTVGGKAADGNFLLQNPAAVRRRNEFAALMELTANLCQYFDDHPLNKLISPEDLLILELAARSPTGLARVDHRFVRELLTGARLGGEEMEVRPRPIEDVVPVDSFETDGEVGGYVDVNRKSVAAVDTLLPSEMVLWRSRTAFLNRLLNEGALHYVRENFEYIDRRLRVLVCFVVDAHPGMSDAPGNLHPAFGRGMTPYVRARVLAALMVQDLARFVPRDDVRVDVGFYLWSPAATAARPGGRVRYLPRAEIDLHAWTPDDAADRFRFAAGMVQQLPELFHGWAGEASADNPMDADPAAFVANRSRTRRYHCRHLVWLTSGRTCAASLPAEDPGLNAGSHSDDSVLVVDCDPVRTTVGVCQPRSLLGAADEFRRGLLGQLGDEQLRKRFLRTVTVKAGGRPADVDPTDQLLELS